jgi:hypothetical protein
VFAIVAVVMLAAPAAVLASERGARMETPAAARGEAVQFNLVQGWYREQNVEYYDFGANTPLGEDGLVATAPIYALIHGFDDDGNPEFVAGQHNIVDVVPGDEGYSDLWEVHLVIVGDDYVPDTIRSAQEVHDGGFEIVKPGLLVNCPIVPEGSTLEEGPALTQGWYKGEAVFYPDFGPTAGHAEPIWVPITGFDDEGMPQFIPGQRNIIDTVPGDANYSPFWQVNFVLVPEDYAANELRSADDVAASGYETIEIEVVVNCPVTSLFEARDFGLVAGWYRSQNVDYYDFGANTPLAGEGLVASAPIYALIHGFDDDGNPEFVAGQHNIVDVIPGDPGYSDLWEVHLVIVGDDYVPDSIRSAEELMDAGFEIVVPGIFVNCPIVPAGSELAEGPGLTQGWYRGDAVFYPDFGPTSGHAEPIWVPISGFDDEGMPQFIPGQRNIIDTVPGDAQYTPFWQVNFVLVDEDYEANDLTSRAEVMASGFEVMEMPVVVNCPVVRVSVDLFEGWNRGIWTGGEVDAEMLLEVLDDGSDPETIDAVAYWDADGEEWLTFYREAPLPAFQTLRGVGHGMEYWFFALGDTELTFPAP